MQYPGRVQRVSRQYRAFRCVRGDSQHKSKERKKAYFYGEKLAQLIATKKLSEGDILHISLDGPQLSIKLVFMGQFAEEDNESDDAMHVENESGDAVGEENESDAMSEEDDPWNYVVVGLRANPTPREKEQVIQMLPPRDSYLGDPFVHRITNTNVANGHVMVCDF